MYFRTLWLMPCYKVYFCQKIKKAPGKKVVPWPSRLFLTRSLPYKGTPPENIHSKSWRPWRPVSANFFHFPPKFRLRTQKPSRLHCTNASPSVCRLCFVFNKNTFYIDLLYFDNFLLKTPDLSQFFLLRFTYFFRQFLEAKK